MKSHLDNCKLLDRDLPVGENLQDHYGTGALTFTVDQVGLFWQQCCDGWLFMLILILFSLSLWFKLDTKTSQGENKQYPNTCMYIIFAVSWNMQYLVLVHWQCSEVWRLVEIYTSRFLEESLYCQIYFELIVRVDVCSQGLAWVPTKFTNKSKDWPGCSFISASVLPMTPCSSPWMPSHLKHISCLIIRWQILMENYCFLETE